MQALLNVLLLFLLLPRSFSNGDLRGHLAQMLGLQPSLMTLGRMTYDLRRLRLHGLIERIPKAHRYRMTPLGLRTAHLHAALRPRATARPFTHHAGGAGGNLGPAHHL